MVRMGEYCSSVRDGTHDTPKPTSDGKYLVTSKAIHDNTIDFSSCYFISQKDFDKINARSKVDKWDVLMTMIGSVGRLLFVRDEPDYAIKNIALFKIGNEDKAKWLYFYLSNKPVQDYFEAIASGTSQHFIGLGHLRKLKIADFNECSKKVVSILSAYDNLIENNNKRIKLLEQMAENLYKEWFVRFRFPGHETTPFENGIPKGWKIAVLGDFGRIETGKTPSMEKTDNYGDDFLFVKTPDMHNKIFVSNTDEKLSNIGHLSQSKKLLPANSIMVSCIGTAGVVAINTKPAHTNQQINSIIIKDHQLLEWLFFTCKSLKETINLFGATGATMTNLSKGKFEKLKVIRPNHEQICSFHKILSPVFSKINCLQTQNQNLIKQRDLLLPRLMSGKLAV